MLHHGTSTDRSPTSWSSTQDATNGARSAKSTPVSALAKPMADALHRFLHVGGRAGVAEANKVPAVDRIEIHARRRRHMRVFQQAPGEIETVVGEFGNVGVEIEGAVDRQGLRQPRLRQSFDQDSPVVL